MIRIQIPEYAIVYWVSLNIKVSILSKIYEAANQQPSTEQISHHVGRAGANQNHALQFIQFQSYAIDVQATNQSELTTPFHHNEQKSNRNNCTNPRYQQAAISHKSDTKTGATETELTQ